MANPLSTVHLQLLQLSEPLRESLSKSTCTPLESHDFNIKSHLQSLLPTPIVSESDLPTQIRDFSLLCAALAFGSASTSSHLNWVPRELAIAANSAFRALAEAFYADSRNDPVSRKIGEFGVDLSSLAEEKRLVVELLPEVLPVIKDRIKESSIDGCDGGDEISAASAKTPVGFAIVAAHQLRWFITQVERPHLGKLCALVVPCGLTALDHWSPEVKGQGMISFIHLMSNVNAAELGSYGDVILDACCQNVVSSDEIWHLAVEMSILVVTCTQKNNPRSPWYEKLMNEMLGHLERQPRDKQRCTAWLNLIEPLFYGIGLVLLAHFRRLFPLFFKWMHSDDDETVLLVLRRINTVVKITWIRNSPYFDRLVDELAILYKEAAMRTAREDIRTEIQRILILLQKCKGLQFEVSWKKHKDDPNLGALVQSINERISRTEGSKQEDLNKSLPVIA